MPFLKQRVRLAIGLLVVVLPLAALWFHLRRSPDVRAEAARLTKGISRDDVRAALGSPMITSRQTNPTPESLDADAPCEWWSWEAGDEMVEAAFNKNGALLHTRTWPTTPPTFRDRLRRLVGW